LVDAELGEFPTAEWVWVAAEAAAVVAAAFTFSESFASVIRGEGGLVGGDGGGIGGGGNWMWNRTPLRPVPHSAPQLV
jgi:hypothetical protein